MASRPATTPPQPRITPEQNGVRFGLLTAAVLCAYTLLAVLAGFFKHIEAGALNALILVGGSVLAMRNLKLVYRDEMPYLGGFGTGIITTMVASVVLAVFFAIITTFMPESIDLTQLQNVFQADLSVIIGALAIILMGTMTGVITSLIAMQYFKADRADPLKALDIER